MFNAVNGFDYYLSGSTFNNRGELTGGTKPYSPGPYVPTSFVSQSWQETILTPSGSLKVTRNTQQEFYNGELKGTEVVVTDGNLNTPVIKQTNDSFVAPYNTVGAYDSYDNWFTAKSGLGVINGLFTYYFAISPEAEFGMEIESEDQNGVDRSSYFDSLGPGDTLYVRITDGTYNEGTVTEFQIASINTRTVGAHTKYAISVTPDSAATLGGDWYINRFENGFPLGFTLAIVFEDNIVDTSGASDNTNPIYNNATEIRKSSVRMQVSYSTSGSGSLQPVNIEQIRAGNAERAQVQDSNYTSTGYSNARYKGTLVSSLGFNIPYSKT